MRNGDPCAPAQGGQQRGERGAAQHRADDAPGAARAAAAPAAHRRAQRVIRAAEPKAGRPLHAMHILRLLILEPLSAGDLQVYRLWLHSEIRLVLPVLQARSRW